MLTKEQMEKMISEQEVLLKRVEDAEVKAKKLEEENLKMARYAPVSHATSDEAKALSAFNCAHPKDLLKINVGAPQYKDVDANLKHLVLNLKRSVDVARMTAQMFHGAPMDDVKSDADPVAVKNICETYYGKNILAPKLKAFGTTVSGGGLEWIPTAVSSSYIQEYILEMVLENRFKQVNMPTPTYDQPVIASGTKARKAVEGGLGTAVNFSTSKLTLSSVKLYDYYEISSELDEDSAPDILSAARDQVVISQQKAAESAIMNGDTSATHMDSDLHAAGADISEKIWIGLRKAALANSANGSTYDLGNAIVDDTKLGVLQARMGKFGTNPAELAWVVGPVVWAQMKRLPSVMTLEKYGPQASVLSGTLGYYFGIPVIVSEYCRENLNATGVYDGITMNRACIQLVNVTRFYVGNRRPIQVKLMQDLPYYDRWLLASYRRVAFKGHPQSATEVSTVLGYNIAK